MAFDEIYERYWSKLYAYAYNRLRDKETCEEIIQEVFVSLWANRKTTKIESSVSGYLYQAVKFQMLNFEESPSTPIPLFQIQLSKSRNLLNLLEDV